MKNIAIHLGAVILALAAVVLCVGVVNFAAPAITDTFSTFNDTLTEKGNDMLNSISTPNAGVVGGAGGSGGESGSGGGNSGPVQSPPIIHEGTIPEGGTYYVRYLNGDKYLEELGPGEPFPATVGECDAYVYGEYIYRYNMDKNRYSAVGEWTDDTAQNGWGVGYIGSSAQPGNMLTRINGVDVVSTAGCFADAAIEVAPEIPSTVNDVIDMFAYCENLTDISKIRIPDGVTDLMSMFYKCSSLVDASGLVIPNTVTKIGDKLGVSGNGGGMFQYCTSLQVAPVLPDTITDMDYAFYNCKALETFTVIPSSVTTYRKAFYGCSSLSGTIVINTNASDNSQCFMGTTQSITITGSCGEDIKAGFAEDYDNVTY